MALLSRPHHAASIATPGVDRALLGAVSVTLGLVLGGLIVAAGGWMATIGREVRQQSMALGEIQARADRADQVGQAAVATLLAQGGSTANPKGFVEELGRTRDELARAKDSARTHEALATTAAAEYRRAVDELAAARDKAAQSDTQAHALRDELDKERESGEWLKADRDAWLKSDAGALSRNYTNAWYAAVIGWVLATGIAAGWGASHWMASRGGGRRVRELA